ncbi:hypothetical protein [Massilia antarctica]|uniref:hypothetical protein n=1 Tax=Massilia antarctica TaxID=2765360 RepID=UPI0006BB8017|nr:hypothetical protein [Massilia sp. H27-R4]MCY0913704.1 DUF4124 domain-containing protein [Massilia sp. H27-R4]CUI04622.1 hypothetical protein BN2497_4021 [Janthinobacterium sp. CG23_2]CUU28408.1 hypothetical protein BN3177_4021 [Janthinobacterium sp. CG23_2]
MAVYKIQRPDGSTEFTDRPQGPGSISSVNRNGSTTTVRERERTADEHNREIKSLIMQARTRGAKLADYLEYIDYLRHYSPVRFDRVMRELRDEDPQAWMKLQKYAQFRPLRETSIGLKAGTNIMGASAGLANGKFGGSMEKWMESTLKDAMKRDRYGPYAEVLGEKASTLPTKTATYSNSRLGQYMKIEVAEAEVASAKAAKELAGSKAALRAAKGTAVVRAAGPVLDVLIAALNPDVLSTAAIVVLRKRMDTMFHDGVLSEEEYIDARNLLSQSKYGELKRSLDKAQAAYVRGVSK